ncbi:MAG: stage VI sporulation protein F [Bacilli bacterium]|nr:stage VI sporulation protein F [Bacilli bacterium]
MLKDNLFKNIENKTNIKKETILSLAAKLQNNNMKNEQTIREIIDEISKITNKKVSEEKKEKIINSIIKDEVPKNIEKIF